MSEEAVQQCQACGATIYQEHLDSGIAGYFQGALLCPHCRQERMKASGPSADAGAEGLETIALIDDEPIATPDAPSGATPLAPRKPAAEAPSPGSSLDAGLHRQLITEGFQATRCRTFHAKLNEGAVAYMNRQINEWADADDNIRIKFATSAIGVFEGKHSDPHLIVSVFY